MQKIVLVALLNAGWMRQGGEEEAWEEEDANCDVGEDAPGTKTEEKEEGEEEEEKKEEEELTKAGRKIERERNKDRDRERERERLIARTGKWR